MGVSRIIKKTSTPFSVMRMGSTKKVCEGSFFRSKQTARNSYLETLNFTHFSRKSRNFHENGHFTKLELITVRRCPERSTGRRRMLSSSSARRKSDDSAKQSIDFCTDTTLILSTSFL